MKSKKVTNLKFQKETISTFDATDIKGGATQSNQQETGCNTNCTATNTTRWY